MRYQGDFVLKPMLKLAGAAALLSYSMVSMAADVKSKLESQLGLEVSAVADSPVEGLQQVTTNKGLFYVSDSGQYFLQARIFDVDNGMQNVTEQSLAQMRLDGIKQFEGSAIEFNAKNEKHVITVFTDITCGYCRKMHKEIEQLNALGISVHYLAFPRAGLNSKVYDEMVSVWCAKDPNAALTAAKQDKSVKTASCDNKVAEQFEFGQSIGVNGTPNIILEDGTLIPGYQPAGVLAQALDG